MRSVLKLLHNKLKESQMNGVRPDAVQGPALDLVRRDQNPDDVDCRIYAFAVLGKVLQFAAVVTGVVFAYCLLTVSPLYLLAEVIPLIIWAVGSEIQNVRVGHDSSLYFPGYSNPPFMQNQPIGIPNRNNNCGPSCVIQLSLISPEINQRLTQLPNHPLTRIRTQYLEAQRAEHRVGQQIQADVLYQGLPRGETADVATVFNHLLQGLFGRDASAIELMLPPCSSNDAEIQRTFTDTLGPLLPQATPELFINIARTPGVRHPVLPIPSFFDHAGAHYEVDAFIVHNSDHYVAYVKKEHPGEADPIWWYANDRRVVMLANAPDRALRQAAIVHYRRTNAEV